MFGIHNTHVKKVFSDIIETNATAPVDPVISKVIVPTLEMQPYIEKVYTLEASESITLPTDKSFYVTNIIMSGQNAVSGNAYGETTVTLDNGDTRIFTLNLGQGEASTYYTSSAQILNIQFPLRGLKLAKGSTMSAAVTGSSAIVDFMVCGYFGSDRG